MAAIGVALLCFAAPAAACTVSSAVVVDLGSFSPSAVKAKAVPAVKSRAGLQCGFAVLKLLGSDNVKATFNSTNAFKLLRAGGGSVAYRVSADEAGVYAATQGATIDYMQNNLLNLLGLLGSSNADLPVWIKPTDDGFPPVGVYKDRISISWSWSICTGLGLVGLCALGSSDTGTGTSVIDITLIVTPRNATLSTSSTTIWDPVNKTSNPRVLPGSRRTVSTTFANPDIVALDGGPIDIVVPTPAGAVLSLDGDGALAGPAITLTEGSPASSMGLQYITPSDPSDDVDFSVDKGQSWTHQPVAGDPVSQSAVTHVRVRARGTMAAMSSFSVQIPYRIR
jgi:hypothetical protein